MRRRRRDCGERVGSSSDEPSGAGAASGRGKGQPRTAERRGRGTIGKAGFEANPVETPPPDPLAAIKAELWRWHLGRVFVHQFALIARRIVPPSAAQKKRDDGTGRGSHWQRRKSGKTPELGLVAFKHQQDQARRVAMTGSFQAAERAADERKPPPDDGGAARGADRGRGRQAVRLRK